MPGLLTHIDLALDSASREGYPHVERHVGSFVLGATAPDIRAMIRARREETHFAPLDAVAINAGVKGMLDTYPSLAHVSSLSEVTQAFVIGYMTHLVADQSWIVRVYRPYFANLAVFPNVDESQVMDRALQMELDRSARLRLKDLSSIRRLLDNAEHGVHVEFIDSLALAHWKDRIVNLMRSEFTWERLRVIMWNHYSQDGPVGDLVNEFLASVPKGLGRIYQRVPKERVEAFREQALDDIAKTVRGYLS